MRQALSGMIDRLRLIDWGWLARIALCFAVALAGALVFLALRWPLPWFLGAMTACLIAAVARVPIERPQALGVPMRIVLGVAIGTAFTPALLGRAGGMALSLALLVPWTLAIIAAGIPYFTRVAGFDRATALFCAVPGGIADMVTLAKDAGADARTVTLVQSTRILAIMLVLPLWVGWHDGLAVGGTSFVGRLRLADIGLVDAAMLIAIGYLGWWGAVRVRLVGAAIVGPMILSALAHAGGLTAAQVPFEIMTVAQITVGAMLGAQFRGLTWRELVRPVALGLVFSAGLIVVTLGLVAGVAALTGFRPTAVLLAFAPGGQVELNLLAFLLQLDVAYVALHHLLRLAVVMLTTQLLVRRLRA